MPLLQLRQALSQAHDAWLELRLVDDALGITIDEPTNPTSQTGYLPIEANDLSSGMVAPSRAWVMRRRYSPATRCGSSKRART